MKKREIFFEKFRKNDEKMKSKAKQIRIDETKKILENCSKTKQIFENEKNQKTQQKNHLKKQKLFFSTFEKTHAKELTTQKN